MEVDLVVTRGPEAGRSVRFYRFPIVIGREPGCDLVLSDPSVSRRHARIRLDGSELILEDLSSKLGSRVNGERVQKARIASSERISLGNTEIRLQAVSRPQPSVQTAAAPLSEPTNAGNVDLEILIHAPDGTSRAVVLSLPETVFGRDGNCDIPVDDFKMSQRHFRIRRAAHQFVLEDLGSTNGTYVEDQLTSWCELKDGARISAGRSRFLARFVRGSEAGKRVASTITPPPKPKYQLHEWADRGLYFSSLGPQPPMGKFLLGLSRMCPLGLLVDSMVRERISSPLPPEAAPLYDWMDPSLAEQASPVLIASESAIPIATELADTDGWVAYFGDGSSEQMLARLRGLAHPPELNQSQASSTEPPADEREGDPGESAARAHPKPISLSRPSILIDLARYGDPGFLDRLLTDFKAVVMEGAEPDAWQAFAKEGFQKALKALGFSQATEEANAKLYATPDE